MATKMLAKVKRMLQAYALARPHLRLSLKILKAKDRKGDWTYPKSGAPSASRLEAGLHAATDIFGKKLTSHCESIFSSWSDTGEQIDEPTIEKIGPSASRDEWYTLEATMAKQDCGTSLSKITRSQIVSTNQTQYRCNSIEQYRPIYISRFQTGVMPKGHFETDRLTIQDSLALCYLQRR